MKLFLLNYFMLVFVGATMNASELMLQKPCALGTQKKSRTELAYQLLVEPSAPESEFSEPSAPEADLSQLLVSPSRMSQSHNLNNVWHPQSPSNVRLPQQQQSQSSMIEMQEPMLVSPQVRYPLSQETRNVAQRLALVAVKKKIKADCLDIHAYVQRNPSVISAQILAHTPQLPEYYFKAFMPLLQKRSVAIVSTPLIAHHDASNILFKDQKERDDFALGLEVYVETKGTINNVQISPPILQLVRSAYFSDKYIKMWASVFAKLEEVQECIEAQLGDIGLDQSSAQAELCKQEHKKQAYGIMKDFLHTYYPDDPESKDEAEFKAWFDSQYKEVASHMARNKMYKVKARKLALKEAKQFKCCVIL